MITKQQVYRVLAIRPGRWMTIADIVSQLKRNVSAIYRTKVRQELMALADAGYLEWQDGLHFGRFRHTDDCNQLIAIATRVAQPARFDMRTQGTYTQGDAWMVASRAGAYDAQQIKSRTTFGGPAHV